MFISDWQKSCRKLNEKYLKSQNKPIEVKIAERQPRIICKKCLVLLYIETLIWRRYSC